MGGGGKQRLPPEHQKLGMGEKIWEGEEKERKEKEGYKREKQPGG